LRFYDSILRLWRSWWQIFDQSVQIRLDVVFTTYG
jgi:hypothetical protein